jgi:hypothetical protein
MSARHLLSCCWRALDEDAEIEEAWVAEAERRAAELDNGKADSVPLAEALAQLRSALK